MRNLIIGLLVVAALVVGGGIIAQTAYQAGLSTAVTTAAASAPAGTVVTPVAPVPYPYYYGGWGGPGYGYGGYGKGGNGDPRSHFQQTFDDWHRQAHSESPADQPTSTRSTPPQDPGA